MMPVDFTRGGGGLDLRAPFIPDVSRIDFWMFSYPVFSSILKFVGSISASILVICLCLLHHVFDHGFGIDFSSILVWI